ncbi:MAG TPA: hypothetical protein VI547_14405 [Anaerolineales bacterium]|nr:hypothetical protein [Anaerolineales bacterium]
MPRLTRWFIKTALAYFVVGLLVGVLVMARSVVALPALVGALGPAYFHLLMVGWVMQLIIGVAFWMFPKFTTEQPRGSETLGWATYILLNAGLILRVIGEPANAVQPQPLLGWLVAASAVLQWLAGMGFVINTWRRVKEK